MFSYFCPKIPKKVKPENIGSLMLMAYIFSLLYVRALLTEQNHISWFKHKLLNLGPV